MREGRPEAGSEGGIDQVVQPGPLADVASESLYDWLAGYGFARRYVGGKVVANIGREALGYGSHLLSRTARHVVGLSDSADAANLASYTHSAPNVEYREAASPAIPYPEAHFDVVVALEAPDAPEGLVEEARRVLKPDGVLIVSTLDRRALLDSGPEGARRRRGAYVPEFRLLLGRHFERVRIFRQGAVAGGFVFPETGQTSPAATESAPASAAFPSVGPEPPTTRRALAVCCRAEVLQDDADQEEPYLLLDRDRHIFDECEDQAGDIELLRDEIARMQETEVQAFRDSYRLLFSEIAFLRAQVRRSEARAWQDARSSEAQYKARIQTLEDRIRDIENSVTWRIFEPYRRLRTTLGALRKGKQDSQ